LKCVGILNAGAGHACARGSEYVYFTS